MASRSLQLPWLPPMVHHPPTSESATAAVVARHPPPTPRTRRRRRVELESPLWITSNRNPCLSRGFNRSPNHHHCYALHHHDQDYKVIEHLLWKNSDSKNRNISALLHVSDQEIMPEVVDMKLLMEMETQGYPSDCKTLSTFMLYFAENGYFAQAQALWDEVINSSFMPSIEVVSNLMDAYSKMGQFGEVARVLNEIASRDITFCPQIYSLAVSCFGRAGQLEMMENTVKEMVSRGFRVDSITGNTFVIYYSIYGSLTEMESAYGRLKRSRVLIEQEAIRAVAAAYITKKKFYKLGEFLRDVGLRRRNAGNLLWNLLLLSFAVNFKMKSLQREFLNMLEAGFSPDLTTFNIRTLAFSRMCMLWDLHLSIEHMRHENVAPDLVTYGCIIDAYLNKRLGRNLSFALGKMNVESMPELSTDPLVFEAFGKGDFHFSSEALLQSTRHRRWTYSKLLSVHLKKQYRSNQIFWNY